MLEIPAGVWFATTTIDELMDDSVDVYECPCEGSCLKGYNNDSAIPTVTCAVGHEPKSPLCGICDGSAGYVRSGDCCTECPSQAASAGVVVAVCLCLVLFLVSSARWRRISALVVVVVHNTTSSLLRCMLPSSVPWMTTRRRARFFSGS